MTDPRPANPISLDGQLGPNPNDPELLEPLKLLRGGGAMPPPSLLTTYNPNPKTDVTL